MNEFFNAFRGGRTFVLSVAFTVGAIVALFAGKITGMEYAAIIAAVAALLSGGKLASGKRAELEGGGMAEVTRAVTGVPEEGCECLASGGQCVGTCDDA